MLFTRKKPNASSTRPAPDGAVAGPSSDGDATVVLDALGSVLQAYARHALDTPQMDAESSRLRIIDWMRHVTIGTRHPSHAGDTPGGLAKRDWRGPVQFFGEHRRGEQQATDKGLRDLRETVWDIVASTHRLAQGDVDCGRAVREQLDRVRSATEGADLSTVRREALAAVAAVGTLMSATLCRACSSGAAISCVATAMLGERVRTAVRAAQFPERAKLDGPVGWHRRHSLAKSS